MAETAEDPPPPAKPRLDVPDEAAAPQPTEGRRLAHRAGTVAGFTLVSRVLGYVRDATLANVFGAGWALDAFIAAQTIPNVLRRLVAEGTLMIAFVPLLAKERKEGGLKAMRGFAAAVLGLLIPVLLGLVLLGLLFPGPAVHLFAAGFDPSRAALAARLTQIMMPFLFFVSLVAVAGGALNTVGVFGPPAAAPVLLNLSIIGCVFGLAGGLNRPIEAAAWGVLVGGACQLLLQIPFLVRSGLYVQPRFDPRHPSVRLLARRMLPAVFGVGVYQLNMVIIRQLASYLPEGQLSCYFFATRLEEFALGVFAVSISVAALPTLSEHAARGDGRALLSTFRRAMRATQFITIPSAVGLGLLSGPIVDILLGHGQFGSEAAELTSELVLMMAFALVPIGAVRVLVPTYYAVGDTRTPVAAATASMLTTALLGWMLADRYQIHGLTGATVAAALVQAGFLGLGLGPRVHRVVGKRSGPEEAPSILGHAVRCVLAVTPGAILAAGFSAAGAWVGLGRVPGALQLAGLGLVFAVIYFGSARLLRLPEVGLLLSVVRRKGSA